MTKRPRMLLFGFATLLVIAGMATLAAYRSLRQVPAFYLAAIEQDETVQADASNECLRQAAALASDVQRPGYWRAVFSAEQINGWLAVDLVRNYPEALPAELENPRVDIHQGQTTLAFGYKQGDVTTVVSIAFDLYLNSPNVVALRVRGVRAGLMPIPLSSVLDGISTAARKFDLELEWRQSHGDPVALIKLPQAYDDDENEMRLDSIEFGEGTLHVAGRTVRGGKHELARLPQMADFEPEPIPQDSAAEDFSQQDFTPPDSAVEESLVQEPIGPEEEIAPEDFEPEMADRQGPDQESPDQETTVADAPDDAEIESAAKEKLQR